MSKVSINKKNTKVIEKVIISGIMKDFNCFEKNSNFCYATQQENINHFFLSSIFFFYFLFILIFFSLNVL